MGWQTDLFCNITFNRETFNNLYEVESKLEEVNILIDYNEKQLQSLILITEPKKFCDEDADPIWYLQSSARDCLESLREYYVERWKLQTLIDNWDKCHNEQGLAINPPEGISWDSAFLDGDFVKTVNNPNMEEL